MQQIPFTRTNYTGIEEKELLNAFHRGDLKGDGPNTLKVHQFFCERYSLNKALFTSSCTDALELAALLSNVGPGDEVIVPSYTFSSTANAFALRGAKIVFIDSSNKHPNMDAQLLESLVNKRTKVIVPVHYAGCAPDMLAIQQIAKQHRLMIVADAAQAVDSKYRNLPVTAWADISTFSFHHTKNMTCGEGGLLALPDDRYSHRAEIIREKGTNRAAFFRGEVDKYTCVDIGSSFLGSELCASVLWGQAQKLNEMQKNRMRLWQTYFHEFQSLADLIQLPQVPADVEHNAHCFYLVCKDLEERSKFLEHLREHKIGAVFHYISLHSSPFYKKMHDGRKLPFSDHYTDGLIRLPLYDSMTETEQSFVIAKVKEFFKK